MINRADKDSTVVVLNKKDYIEGLKLLDSPLVYKQLKSDTTPFIRSFIMRFLDNVAFNKWLPGNLSFCTPGRLQNIPTVLPKKDSQKSNGD